MKHLKKFNENLDKVLYNKDLIESLKELSLEYLDEGCVLNYYIMTLNGDKIFYGGQYSHQEDRFNCYSKIRPDSGYIKYLVMINSKPYHKRIVQSSTFGDEFITQSDFNKELSKELVSVLREMYPKENIATK